MGKFFGTDGIRGVANKDLTPEMAFKLGRVVAHILASDYKEPIILIGKDTRISGDMLESALTAGICSRGVSVYNLGILPTPGIAYLARYLKAQAGAVISASHNLMQDNGIKFFNQYGFKLSDEIEAEIEACLLNKEEDTMPRPTGKNVGHIIYLHKGKDIYKTYLKKIFNDTLKGMNIVVDNANGAASNVMPSILRSLGPTSLISISDEPNGININEDCGSTNIKNLKDRVIQCKADIGIAHDGDADRMLAVDELGRVVDGDQIMAICAGYLKEKGKLKNNLLVGTVMSNLGLRKFCEERDINYSVTGVGDRYVLEEMVKRDAILGGEQSGHIIFKEYSTTGDGLLTALMLMKVMKEKKQKLSTLADQMKIYPQTMRNIKVDNKEKILNNVAFKKAIKESSRILKNRGNILVRPSGTEPLIRIMAEGENLEEIENIVKDLAKIIQQLRAY